MINSGAGGDGEVLRVLRGEREVVVVGRESETTHRPDADEAVVLEKTYGEMSVRGRGRLEEPLWDWPRR